MCTTTTHDYLDQQVKAFVQRLDRKNNIEYLIHHGYSASRPYFLHVLKMEIERRNTPQLYEYFAREFDLSQADMIADMILQAVGYEIVGMEFDKIAYAQHLKYKYNNKLKYEFENKFPVS